MAYAVRHVNTIKYSKGEDSFVVDSIVVYVETVADALAEGVRRFKTSEANITVALLDDTMPDSMLPPEDEPIVVNITDAMRGASQSKVYGSG